jgi:intracellular sulfur oxidation DsrE/DsrF family protein
MIARHPKLPNGRQLKSQATGGGSLTPVMSLSANDGILSPCSGGDPIMQRRLLGRSAGGLVLAALATPSATTHAAPPEADQPESHRIAFHVGSADPAMMNVALHNIANAVDYYAARNEIVAIELVANGPGYVMLRADTSPVKADIAELHRKYPFVVFSACQMSRKGAAKAEGKAVQDIPQVPEATDVPAGIVRLSELQEQDFSYIRV